MPRELDALRQNEIPIDGKRKAKHFHNLLPSLSAVIWTSLIIYNQ